MKTYAIAAVIAFLVGVIVVASTGQKITRPTSGTEFSQITVAIYNTAKNSGGTGVIINSSSVANETVILTNAHVCQLIQVGGVVQTEDKIDYPVKSFQAYKEHDLCLVHIAANLNARTELASEAPRTYDQATAAGHPNLLPLIMTKGHTTAEVPINIMVYIAPCATKKDVEQWGMFCMFIGKPLFRTFDAVATSITIMPGSSGSGVFNNQGQLVGLVFAGPGEGLGYGFVVPFRYLKDFLSHLSKYEVEVPDSKRKPKNYLKGVSKIRNICRTNYQVCNDFVLPGIL